MAAPPERDEACACRLIQARLAGYPKPSAGLADSFDWLAEATGYPV